MNGRKVRSGTAWAHPAEPVLSGPQPVAGLPAAVACTAAARYWQSMLDALPHAAWVAELHSRRLVAVNAAAVRLYERPASALLQEHADVLVASPEDHAWWQAADEVACAGAPQQALDALHSDTVIGIPDGRVLHVARSIRGLAGRPDDEGVTHALVMLIDGSAQQRAQVEREKLLADLQATLEATADGILVTDLGGRIRVFNQRFANLWALPMDLLHQRDHHAVQVWMHDRVAGDAAARHSYQQRWQMINDAVELTDTARIELQGGGVLERVTRPLFQAGSVHGRVWSFRDLTEQLAARQKLDIMARQDTLTGLPNRRMLAEQVVDLLALPEARGGSQDGFALLMVDLDCFAQVNDGMGQAAGDRVLCEVAQRIGACLRQEDLLARLGGDQFAVLVRAAHAEGAEAAARRILRVVGEPYTMNADPFTLTCSVGVALAPSHGQSLDELVRHAEAAVRTAKQQGRGGYRLYQARSEVDRHDHMALDHAMRQALVSGRFRLNYQPQVSLSDGRVLGAEALLRWRDPEMGEIPPGRFIPVAEASGFIVAIGDWVLSQAVRQAALWHQRGLAIPIAINVSALQFQQAHFVERVASVLAVSGLPPHLLELELTESILVLDADEALRRLEALAQLGLRLSIDDFGTGYSSLAYLKRFPIDKLKIDRSFVRGLPADDSDAGIVQAILQMARALRLKVVAEGVETEEQRVFLRDRGCDQYQGFLFAPALDPVSFEERLRVSAQQRVETVEPGSRVRLVQG
jgi:diguanylate cyclase (GGDEF)-like protein